MVVLFTFIAVAARANRSSAKYREVAKLIEEWRYEEAQALVETLENSAETRYLRGELAFFHGDYALAERILSAPSGPLNQQSQALQSLVRSTAEATRDFARVQSKNGHFEIHYRPGKDQVLVELAGDALDQAYEVLAKDLGVVPAEPVRVEFLGEPADLAKTSTLTEKEIKTTSTIALCKYNKLMAVSPRATMFGYAWLDTLVHEYVHYLVSVRSGDRVPVWLHEGLARFEQTRWRRAPGGYLSATDEHLLARALRKNNFIAWKDMHPSMAKLPSQEAAALAYAEVLTMIQFVHAETGYAGLQQIMDHIRDGIDATDAIAKVVGKPWPRIEVLWRRFLRAARLKTRAELSGRAKQGRLRFRSGGEDTGNVGIEEIRNVKARRFARLGGMLRARGMPQAAAIEYEKALNQAGHHPLIAAKLSRTYLDLKKFARAIKLAEELLDIDDNDAVPATTLGAAYLATQLPERAALAYERAIRINPFDPSVRCGLASAYKLLGKKALAAREQIACKLLRQP